MPKNKIEDLRNLLFETMERLMDPDDPMDVRTASAVGDVAQVVVNSAKVEIDFLKQTGHGGTSFIQPTSLPPAPLAVVPTLPAGEFVPEEKLCQQCTLPECNDTSPKCLIKIQRKRFEKAA